MEVSCILTAVLAFLLASAIQLVLAYYVLAFLFGLALGKLLYHRRNDNLLPYALIAFSLLLGFVIGARGGSFILISLLYVLGIFFSIYFHEKHFMG